MSPDKFAPYRLLSGGAQSPRLHRRLDVYMSTWLLLLHSLVSLRDMNASVYFSTSTSLSPINTSQFTSLSEPSLLVDSHANGRSIQTSELMNNDRVSSTSLNRGVGSRIRPKSPVGICIF